MVAWPARLAMFANPFHSTGSRAASPDPGPIGPLFRADGGHANLPPGPVVPPGAAHRGAAPLATRQPGRHRLTRPPATGPASAHGLGAVQGLADDVRVPGVLGRLGDHV